MAPVAGGVLGLIALGLGVFALFLGRNPATAGGPGTGGRGRANADSGDAAPTAPLDDEPITTPDVGGDPATEAFSAQPRPDESQTEAIDFRKRDER